MSYVCGQNIKYRPDILTANQSETLPYSAWLLKPFCFAFSLAFRLRSSLYGARQSGLVQHIDHAALGEGFFQAAKVRVLLAECCQPLPQSGIVGLDVGGVLALVEQDNGLFLILRQGHTRHPPIQQPDKTGTFGGTLSKKTLDKISAYRSDYKILDENSLSEFQTIIDSFNEYIEGGGKS